MARSRRTRRSRTRAAVHRTRQIANYVWHRGWQTAVRLRLCCRRQRDDALPAVLLLTPTPHGRRLRRQVARAAHLYAGALGAVLPPDTAIIIAAAVCDGQPAPGLVELIATPDGTRRAVLHLATHLDGVAVGDDRLLAVLRRQITWLVEVTTGATITAMSFTAPASARPAAPIVPLRPRLQPSRNGAAPRPGAPDFPWLGPAHRPDDEPA